MPTVQFFKHTDTSVIEQLLRNYFPASIAIYHRIRSPQNTPERQTVVLANFPPPTTYSDAAEIETDRFPGPAMVSFVDRSRPNESQIAIFSTLLCLRETQTKDSLSKDSRQLLADQLRALFRTVHDIGHSYATAADIKPLNYPFAPILRFTASHQIIAEILVQDLAIEPVYYNEWDELIFSTHEVKQMMASRKLQEGYQLGQVPPTEIDVVVGTSKVKREASTLLENHNASVLFTADPGAATIANKQVVAWAYLSIDQSLTTLYVTEAHRGKGLAKIVVGALMRDLCDGVVHHGKIQSDWCLAQVAADNDESQGVCKSLGASFNKRTVNLGFDLDAWLAGRRSNISQVDEGGGFVG